MVLDLLFLSFLFLFFLFLKDNKVNTKCFFLCNIMYYMGHICMLNCVYIHAHTDGHIFVGVRVWEIHATSLKQYIEIYVFASALKCYISFLLS